MYKLHICVTPSTAPLDITNTKLFIERMRASSFLLVVMVETQCQTTNKNLDLCLIQGSVHMITWTVCRATALCQKGSEWSASSVALCPTRRCRLPGCDPAAPCDPVHPRSASYWTTKTEALAFNVPWRTSIPSLWFVFNMIWNRMLPNTNWKQYCYWYAHVSMIGSTYCWLGLSSSSSSSWMRLWTSCSMVATSWPLHSGAKSDFH